MNDMIIENDITSIIFAVGFVIMSFMVVSTFLSYNPSHYGRIYGHDDDEQSLIEQLRELTTIPKYMEQWVYNSERDVFVLKVGDDVLTLYDMALDINEHDIDCGDDLDDEIEEAFERLSEFYETNTDSQHKRKILEVMAKVLK